MSQSSKNTEYVPPSDETITRIAQDTSKGMAARHDDEGFLDPEVVWGLAAFIKLIAAIKARQLNKQNGSDFDSLEKPDYSSNT